MRFRFTHNPSAGRRTLDCMHLPALSVIAGGLTLLIWIYLLLARGGFWRVVQNLAPQINAQSGPKRIAAIIPARNEADVITQSITSLLEQSGPAVLHIFLVDDGSSDGTAHAAREAANSQALTIIQGRRLPPGWSGKLWAMQQGIEQAQPLHPDFFLLTDADITHAPENLAALLNIAENGGYELASFMVRLHAKTLPEKFLIPAFVFFFFKLYPPAWIRNPRKKTAGAAGGCILIRPEALERAGGIEAIRNQIIDDCALAERVKASGGKVWLGLTISAASLRPYPSFASIGRMIARTAFNQLHHSTLMLLAALLGLTITYLLPIALLFSGNTLAMASGAASWTLMTAAYLPMVRFYRLHPLWALLLPLAAVFYMAAAFYSALNFWSGKGGEWKGRVQDPAQARSSF